MVPLEANSEKQTDCCEQTRSRGSRSGLMKCRARTLDEPVRYGRKAPAAIAAERHHDSQVSMRGL